MPDMPDAATYEIQRRATLASADERAAVRALAIRCNQAEGLDLKLSVPDGDYANERLCAYLAYDGDQLVGLCTLDGLGHSTVEVCGMVAPEQRRRGIGTALLRAALAEARRHDDTNHVLLICEDASQSAQGFIQRFHLPREFTELRMEVAAPPAPVAQRLTIRPATSADAETIDRIAARAFGEVEGNRVADIIADIASPSERFYLASQGDTPIATLKVYYAAPKAYIYGFGVQPEYQRQGIGREFISRIITQLMAEGWSPVGLEVDGDNARALALYRSLGFAEITIYGYYLIDPQRSI